MGQNSQPTNEPNILGQFASVVGLLGASLYFTGWIYRWQYYGFFQLEVTTLDLPVESFLLVPIQVLFGDTWAVLWTAIAFILTILFIHLTLWLLHNLGNPAAKLLNLWQQKIIAYYQRQRKKSLLARMLKSLAEFSSLKISSVKFLRSLLDETIIVAWVLIVLFILARHQGFTDARRDAIDQTSTLPVVTLVSHEERLAIGRSLKDSASDPSLQNNRFIGDENLFKKLLTQGYNDTLDPKKAKIWRFLIERNGWIYLFQTIPQDAVLEQRPPVVAIQEGDAGDRLIIRSSEYLKPTTK